MPEDFEETLINLHLSSLKNTASKTWVIGDISRDYIGGNKVLKTEALPDGLNLPTPQKVWDWDIAPRGEVDLKMSIKHKVGVWDLSQN